MQASGDATEPELERVAGLPRPRDRIGAGQARRIALAACGFGEARTESPAIRHLSRVTQRLGLVQQAGLGPQGSQMRKRIDWRAESGKYTW